jgi:hypothetical protein
MKTSINKISILTILLSLFLFSCGGITPGKKVKEPFSGSKYQSNNKYFRATGKGESKSQQIAKSKAMTNAKTNLAGMVRSNMRRVADVYIAETGNGDASDLAEKFQSLSREIVNQDIADLRVIGDETYKNDEGKYTSYVALEAKKKSMYKWLKKLIKLDNKADAATKKEMEKMIDKEIKRLEDLDEEEDTKKVD